jgi:long-chain acyl-CoA synthetase
LQAAAPSAAKRRGPTEQPAACRLPPDRDTFPKLLLHHAAVRGDRPACREKNYGIWVSSTWAQVRQEVEALACGLAAMGFRRGDKLAIIGDNRPRLYWAIAATQALGGIPVPVYQDSIADEMAFVLDHAEIRFAVAEDQEQVDKLLSVKERCPLLEIFVFDDARGMRHYPREFLHDYAEVQQLGRAFAAENPGFLEGEIAKSRGSDAAIILYTSGTTGRPKGVVLTYENLLVTAQNAGNFDGLREDDESLAYLPMAWIGEHIFSYGQAWSIGFCVSCPESGATVMTDLRELGPTYFFAPPRIFESILTQVMIRMEDAGWVKRRLFHFFMDVARRVGPAILDKQSVRLADRALYALGRWLVYEPLKNTLGFTRIRLAYTAGEAIGPDLFVFYRSLGINLKQLYGMTESSVFICIQPDGQVKPDTVGIPIDEVEVRIADSGEVLFRSPGAFDHYFKSPEATAETKRPDGWVLTGDAGFFDADGHLKIIDRAKDVGRLDDGTLFAPKYIENKLKFFPFVKEAVAFGHGRPSAAAFINIDLEAVGNWAEKRNIAYGSYQELAALDGVYALIQECVEKVNRDLSKEPTLAGSQIRRFLILHKELDADDGELTRTRKVRRRFIAERYGPLVDALYSGRSTGRIETEVTFEDGRKGMMKAELQIREAAIFPAAANSSEQLRKAS